MADGDDHLIGAADPWRAQLGALGTFIRAQRRLADLSLREMAALTRVSNAYLSQVERGLHQPSLTVLRAISGALGLSTEQLLAQAGWAEPDAGDATDAGDAGGAGDAATSGDEHAGGTEESIRTDPRLTDSQREALLGVYRSFVTGTDR
ncbi:MAG: helix-turn-helix domain-containing protein [Pseudonocardiaceae bacterium]|nr:helix-turn-helix domain-containing protein [Pseudonocardiaceae bacterium]